MRFPCVCRAGCPSEELGEDDPIGWFELEEEWDEADVKLRQCRVAQVSHAELRLLHVAAPRSGSGSGSGSGAGSGSGPGPGPGPACGTARMRRGRDHRSLGSRDGRHHPGTQGAVTIQGKCASLGLRPVGQVSQERGCAAEHWKPVMAPLPAARLGHGGQDSRGGGWEGAPWPEGMSAMPPWLGGQSLLSGPRFSQPSCQPQ